MVDSLRNKRFPFFSVTGMGSLPPMELSQALDSVFALDIPYLPTFPRGYFFFDSGKLPQYFSPQEQRPCLESKLGPTENMLDAWNPEKDEVAWPEFLERCRRDKPSYVKWQVPGPLTLYQTSRESFKRDDFCEGLRKKIRSRLSSLQALSIQVLLFLDEPVLGLDAKPTPVISEAWDVLAELLGLVRAEGALSGVHSCAPGPFAPLFDLAFDYFSFDVELAWDKLLLHREAWLAWLKRGGRFALGCVPTSLAPSWRPMDYEKKFSQAFGEEGSLFLRESLLTPACGLGMLTLEETQEVWRRISEIKSGLSVRR